MSISLVTGANGHLGNNLVRALLKKGVNVRAGIRSLENSKTLEGLDCEIVHCDLLDSDSLKKALEGVDTLYQVAAVFKHWAEDEEKEIVGPNVKGTRAILEAAKEAGVRKIVYVSSIASLEQTNRNSKGEILDEAYNVSDQGNPYVRAKTRSEEEAWKVAEELDLDLVAVLPSTIIGGEYKKQTETINAFSAVVNGRMPFTYDMYLSLIDANDVAKGMVLAAEKGVKGSRYILSNTEALSMRKIVEIAKEINPDLKPPAFLDEKAIYDLAAKAEEEAKRTNTRPAIIRSNVKRTLGVDFKFDLSKTISDLGYSPRPAEEVLRETLKELYIGK